jgi:hypothetical protein
MNIATGIFTTAVIHVAMAVIVLCNVAISVMLVAHQIGFETDKSVHHRFEFGNAVILYGNGSN